VRWRIWSAAFAVVALGLLARADDPPKKADDKKQAEPKTPAETLAAIRKTVDTAMEALVKSSDELRNAKDGDKDKPEKQAAYDKSLAEYRKLDEEAGPKYAALAKEFPADPAALDAIQMAMQSGGGGLPADLIKIVKAHHLKSPKLAGLVQALMYDESADGESLLKSIAAESTEKQAKGPALFALVHRAFEKIAGYDSQATKADYDKVKPEVEKQLEAVSKDFADVKFGRSGTLGGEVEKLKGQLSRAEALLVGQPVPEISAEDIDGTAFKLSDYKGKVVMIDFWGDW